MLTLLQGTLPPLSAPYAFQQNKENELFSTIVEQTREIVSSNLIKSSSFNSIEENRFDLLINLVKSQERNHLKGEDIYEQNPIQTSSFHYPSNKNLFYSPFKQFIYPSQNVYQTLPNSSAANTAAAIFQAYEQFNSKSTAIPSINNQQQIRR